jgi:hypothetical protein
MQLAGLHTAVRPYAEWCMAVANYFGIPVTVTSVTRSWEEQVKLRAQYEACLARGEKISPDNPNSQCRYPANRPGDSAHNFGLAWDSWVPSEYQSSWDYIRRYAGFTVPENDKIHAEVPEWRAAVSIG